MKAYGQVDGASHPTPASTAREDQWAATVADPEFWDWLHDHAEAESVGRCGLDREAFQDLAGAAAKLLYVRAQTLRQVLRALGVSDRGLAAERRRRQG